MMMMYFAIGIKEVKVKMANFTYTSLLEPLVSPGQDENVPSDGDEQFLFSDTSEENDKGDNQPSISIVNFLKAVEEYFLIMTLRMQKIVSALKN
ncbi:hypothetical protein Leryth_011901 [Lithospermum erythrorhizon]|nr:hypothetical protein Leryth_011901 [Lithospermum erythrorhizon]